MSAPLLSSAPFLVLLALASCSTAPGTAAGKSDLEGRAASALAKAETNNPRLADVVRESRGYAVFPEVGKGAVGVGGAYGKGVLYEGGRVVGFCDLTQGSIGAQLGGQTYTEIIAFSTQPALDRFKGGNLSFDAQATAVALHSSSATNASFSDGVAVFTTNATGLMAEAAIGGQKFSYEAK